MFVNPFDLQRDLQKLEEVEKASLRLVSQAIFDFRHIAAEIFRAEKDLVADIGEDISREALDRLGVSKIDERLFGKMDYKRARYVFHPEYAIRQALFVDSKAEQMSGQTTATLQTSQTSLRIKFIRSGKPVDEKGKLPTVIETAKGTTLLTTTIFVKYNYREDGQDNGLVGITIAALPNGMLQSIYNPTPQNTIWLVGRHAPTRGEEFRVRLNFGALKKKARWRVQRILFTTDLFAWDE